MRKALLASLLLIAACNRPQVVESPDGVLVLGEVEESATESRTLALSGRTLIIEGENGAVSLTGGAGEEVDLSFNIRARGDSRDAARQQLDNLLLEETGDEVTYKIDIRPDNEDLTNVDVTGTIPRGATLKLILRSGHVSLTNLDGRIDVLLENGDIAYLGGSGVLSLTTRNGDVAADFYALGSGDEIELASTNGDVTLGLSPTAAAKVSASTRAGFLRTDGFEFSNPKLAQRGAGARFSGASGSDGGSVNMKTQNGDLIFRNNALTAPEMEPVDEPVQDATGTTPDSSAADTTDNAIVNATDSSSAAPNIEEKSIRLADTLENAIPVGLGRPLPDTTGQ